MWYVQGCGGWRLPIIFPECGSIKKCLWLFELIWTLAGRDSTLELAEG